MYGTDKNINVLNGKELTKIEKNGEYELKFHTKEGEIYRMYHEQDCCEHVYIEDIIGDLGDLVDSPITMAEQISEDRPPLDEDEESYTWTFYKFATIKGYVTIRWYGSSNGYYSESVDFVLENNE